MDALHKLGLEKEAGHRPVQLTTDQQRFVGIARAIVCQPELFLLEDPYEGFNEAQAERAAQMFRALLEQGTGLLISLTQSRSGVLGFTAQCTVPTFGDSMSTERDAEKRIERRVGAFLLLCLAGLSILAGLAIVENDVLRSKHEYYLVLDHGTGIAPGVLVTLSGIQVGAVTDVGLTEDRKVAMTLSVDRRYAAYIYADSIGRATTTLGGKTILIEGGLKESGPPGEGRYTPKRPPLRHHVVS